MYKLVVGSVEDGNKFTPDHAGIFVYPIEYRWRNMHQNMCRTPCFLLIIAIWLKPASNDLGVYVNKFGKTSVVWRYTLQSIGPSGVALNY